MPKRQGFGGGRIAPAAVRGDGLFLVITNAGVKTWVYRYRHREGSQTATLGRYPAIGLAAAREERDRIAALAASGKHLTEHKREQRSKRGDDQAGTFRVVAESWRKHEARRMQWTPDYAQEVKRSIDNHLADLLPMHVAKIDVRTIADVLRPVESKRVSMGKKVRQRVRAILDHAVGEGLIMMNPTPATRRGKAGAKRNYPAIVELKGVGTILRDARKADVCQA